MQATDRSSAPAPEPQRPRGANPREAGTPQQQLDPLASAAAIRDQVAVLRDDAAHLVDLGRAARAGLEWSLRERLDRNPYAVLASAAGIGAVLGGAITPALVFAVASTTIRVTAAAAMRGALVQALGAGLGRAAGGDGRSAGGNHEPRTATNP